MKTIIPHGDRVKQQCMKLERTATHKKVALGPPGEDSETSMKVPIDHSQPLILPARATVLERLRAPC